MQRVLWEFRGGTWHNVETQGRLTRGGTLCARERKGAGARGWGGGEGCLGDKTKE